MGTREAIGRVVATLGQASRACRVALVALVALATTGGAAAGGTVGVVAAGLGGTPEYAAAFAEDARRVAAGLASLGGDEDAIALIDENADREAILEALEARAARDAETLVLVLIGHGTNDARDWKFNVEGPDLTGGDIVAALAGARAGRQLVVLGASASGALLEVLAEPGRVVVTATKSGGEVNAVRFPRHFAEALDSDVADIDRNEILTVAEAFRYADARTREHYESEKLLASEHARIEGEEAATLALARLGSLRRAGEDPAVAALLETRLTLERAYRELLARKPDLATDDYYAELETLMLSIAGLQQAIDRASGWSESDAGS